MTPAYIRSVDDSVLVQGHCKLVLMQAQWYQSQQVERITQDLDLKIQPKQAAHCNALFKQTFTFLYNLPVRLKPWVQCTIVHNSVPGSMFCLQ